MTFRACSNAPAVVTASDKDQRGAIASAVNAERRASSQRRLPRTVSDEDMKALPGRLLLFVIDGEAAGYHLA